VVEVGDGEVAVAVFACRDPLCDALVRPGRVVAHLVLGQDGAQVALAEDQHAEARDHLKSLTTTGRLGQPWEVATAPFLASPDSSYVSGALESGSVAHEPLLCEYTAILMA
jgi:NAD(P)-dependent dehydrogenase (short-subunit alcohol dehydrogenase family)